MSSDHLRWRRASGLLSRFGLATAVGIVAGAGVANADEPRIWRFSGAELFSALEGDLAPEVTDQELRRALSGAKGHAYVAGVADATETKKWCGEGAVLPHELIDRVMTYLSDLSAKRLDENAAVLVGEALAKSFPCGPRRVR